MHSSHAQSDDVLSFFSGAGGFSYGFALAGLKPLCGAEIDQYACATYERNVGSDCHNVDLSSIDPEYFRKIAGGRAPFAVIGGPPCQGFSTAGSRDSSDPRNRLIFNYLNIVDRLRPRWFIFENVEGLLTSGHGAAVYALVKEFLRIGYSVRVQKVNLAAYGVPQTRKRVLIIGNCLGIDFEFPEETQSYASGKSKKHSGKPFAPTLDEALAGLPAAGKSRQEKINYSSEVPVNDFDARMRLGNKGGSLTEHFQNVDVKDDEMYSLLRPGQTMKDLPQEYWHESFRRRAFRRVQDGTPTDKRGGAPSGVKRLNGDLQSLTITGAASREFIHPHENRPLTIRECARIQTFPDLYSFSGNAASVIQQIGNAVPPLAASVFARHLEMLDGRFGSGVASPRKGDARLLGYMLTEAFGMSEALQKTELLLRGIQQQQLEFGEL
ncbi:DNA (cytosine-5-)-methyltransferase [Acidovorax sp. SUPP1855]|uniref:DNA cytosine methyltransferase n=1 Tax=Acidovorax sp. SUPP1855 TaxID=431774 RepID=UPI0023DE547A|nr:DNA cytosine methyltransferase [Acidovorax sp. SUPP1855]GKS83840.1 DNA (cytosine-5-)-methyltransferase [Acidovorax sp. SUPP1855]